MTIVTLERAQIYAASEPDPDAHYLKPPKEGVKFKQRDQNAR